MRRFRSGLTMAFLSVGTAVVAGCAASPTTIIGGGDITVTAQFDNASGMYVGNAVSVLGMKIGRVESIKPRDGYVDVTMSMDDSVRVPASAMAVTVTDSILTDRHIELTPAYRGGPTMRDKQILPLQQTKTPVEFDSVLATVDKLTKSLGGDGKGSGPLRNIIDTGAAATDGNGESIRSAMGELSKALQLSDDKGAVTSDAITSIISNLDTLTTAAAKNDETIRQFGSGVNQLSNLLADLNLGAGDTGTKLNQILSQATAILQQNRPDLNKTVTNTNTITKVLKDNDGNLAEFFSVFPMAVDNAYNAIDQNIGAVRVHANPDNIILDSQMTKEVCNLLKLRQLGCATGKISDMGPDFGLVSMLAGLAGVGK